MSEDSVLLRCQFSANGSIVLMQYQSKSQQAFKNRNRLKFMWKCEGPTITEITVKNKEQSWKANTAWFQDLLSSCSNQNSVILTKR